MIIGSTGMSICKHLNFELTNADEERANRRKYNSVYAMREFAKWYKKQRF
jgi:hypothetical protein